MRPACGPQPPSPPTSPPSHHHSICQFCEAVHTTLPYTLAVYLVRHLLSADATEGAVARATGGLVALWCLAQLFTSIPWGRVSDRVGRKPVIVVSALASAVSTVAFGGATSLKTAAVARFVGGALNATFVALKCVLAESCPPGAQAAPMSLLATGWGVGTLVGPALGGLSSPCGWWPARAAGARVCAPGTGLFVVRPFLPPAIVASSLSLLSIVAAVAWLEETLPAARGGGRAARGRALKAHLSDVELADVSAEREREHAPLLDSKRPLPRVATPPRPSPPAQPWTLRTAPPPCLAALAGYGAVAFLYNLQDELLPLFAAAPATAGGLGMAPAALALPLAVGGVALVLFSQLGYVHVSAAAGGAVATARLGLAGWALPCALFPLPSLLPVGAPRLRSAALSFLAAARSLAANCAFTSAMVLVNEAAPPGSAGAVNGAGQTLASAARAAGPAVAGLLWGAAAGVRGGQFAPFALAGVGLAAAAGIYKHVRPPPGEREGEVGSRGGEERIAVLAPLPPEPPR